MSRPHATLTGALALAAVAEEPEGSPLSAATLRRIESAVESARRDIRAHVEEHGPSATARAMGIARSALQRWRSGWLSAG